MRISPVSEVTIARQTYEAVDIDALLDPLGGMSNFVSKGERVCLKVNLLQASDP